MKTAQFTEFRKHATAFLDEVEKGEVIRIFRHGKPVADLTPVSGGRAPSWKQAPPRIVLSGASLSKAILENRAHAPR